MIDAYYHTVNITSVKEEDIPKLVEMLCYGDGRDGRLHGFMTFDENDCEKIYRMMV